MSDGRRRLYERRSRTSTNPDTIAYDHLPRRAHTNLRPRFRIWDDLAEQSIDSLLNTPKAGVGTVIALVDELGRVPDVDSGWILGSRGEFDRHITPATR